MQMHFSKSKCFLRKAKKGDNENENENDIDIDNDIDIENGNENVYVDNIKYLLPLPLLNIL